MIKFHHGNRELFRKIERALFLLCLDKEAPITMDEVR
jgi:hypothetical protein